MGTTVVIIVGSLVSWITRSSTSDNIDRDLLSPVIHRYDCYLKYIINFDLIYLKVLN